LIAKGYFQTPKKTVDYMVAKLFEKRLPLRTDRILDAGCGPGDFIDGILRWCKAHQTELPLITGIELDPVHFEVAQKKYENVPQITILHADFLLWESVEFEYIISNPPYVQITALGDEEKNLYKPIFKSAIERFDLYMLFFEKSLSLLGENGRLVFITPEKYTYVNTAKELRKIISGFQVTEIEHVGENVFQGMTTYPTITTIDNIDAKTDSIIKLRKGDVKRVTIPKDGSSWLPLFNGKERESSEHYLVDICERISCGIATGADRIFIQKTERFEDDLLPYTHFSISGRELQYGEILPEPRYSILVPYDKEGKLRALDDLGPLKTFLEKQEIKEALENRTCAKKKPWYAFHENPPMKSILKPKILCKDVSVKAEFWLDSTGKFFPRHSVYYIVPKNQSILEKLFEYLNSDFVLEWLDQHCQRASNGCIRLQSTILKKIPIPEALYNLSVTLNSMSSVQRNAVFAEAVRHYWRVRNKQGIDQQNRGVSDTGTRAKVTGGKHMDGFAEAIVEHLVNANIPSSVIFTNRKIVIPGFYRPSKKWDLLVVSDGRLIAAVELKSLTGDLGKNYNNRVEEAIGNSEDLWTAYREGAFGSSPQPWLGYLFLLEDGPKTHKTRMVHEPHFKVLNEFNTTSFAQRCELLCRKLVLERKYNSACFVLSEEKIVNQKDNYNVPASDLSANQFLKQLITHVKANMI